MWLAFQTFALECPSFGSRGRPIAPYRIKMGSPVTLPDPSWVTMSKQETLNLKQEQAISPAWLKIERARHPKRPSPMDFIDGVFSDFSEIHGDRAFGDDEAVACGMARLEGDQVMVVGIRKGVTLKKRIKSNFGMPNPEGYRKALRCMRIAEKFGRPVICIVDVIGAYPGPGAEERGQGEAIARNLREMSRLRVPTISVITGEGGSGGALALAVADRVLMLENAVYFVAPPEFAASLIWRNPEQKHLAAEAMRISAREVAELGCVDGIVPEPLGGAHTDRMAAIELLSSALKRHLLELKAIPLETLVEVRQRKFRNIAPFYTEA
jgi:acetyl-CoA carboxylase carboxyl transferase subunit alpha